MLVVIKGKNPRFNSFEALYNNLALPLTKFVIKRIGGNPEAVDEVLSETMIAAWKGFKSFRHKSSYFTWLCRISLNKIADYWRDQVNENSHIVVPGIQKLLSLPSEEISAEEKLSLEELKKSVNDCLNLLPYEKRQLLWFRYWKDYSYAQIAKMLGISERAVEGKLYRARASFETVFAKTLSKEKQSQRYKFSQSSRVR